MARNVTFSGNVQNDITSWLQDLSEESGTLLGEIMQEEVSITDDNATDFREALPLLDKALEVVAQLRKHRAVQMNPRDRERPIMGVYTTTASGGRRLVG